MTKGDRVRVKESGKLGRVAYVRMAPPTYSKPEAVSVVLDEKRDRVGYAGSIFPADKVELVS